MGNGYQRPPNDPIKITKEPFESGNVQSELLAEDLKRERKSPGMLQDDPKDMPVKNEKSFKVSKK